MIKSLAKILILEDMPTDVELIKRQIKRVASDTLFAVAKSRSEFLEKLEWFDPDLILADYRLPDTNGLEVLLYVKEHRPEIPFLFITGTLNDEEKVAETILKGASGYLLKDNLNKLPSKLEEIWQDHTLAQSEMEAYRQKERESRLLLQKVISLVEHSKFEQQEEVLSILHAVSRNLADRQTTPPAQVS